MKKLLPVKECAFLCFTFLLTSIVHSEELKSNDVFGNIPFKSINHDFLIHDVERRGVVKVPFDYDNTGNTINVFYRLIPSLSGDNSKPILVVINGGPGASSWGYHPIRYDYSSVKPSEISELRKYFRVLLIDQRGTGYSAPLDLNSRHLSADVIARYFDHDEQAKDHTAVIEKVIPEDQEYFLLARSYGGLVGFEHLLKSTRQPKGYIFSSAIQPHLDSAQVFAKRRYKQKLLNLVLQEQSEDTVTKLVQLRALLKSVGLEQERVNILWSFLGRNENWIHELNQELSKLLAISTREEMLQVLSVDNLSTVNLLNYVLSSKSLTPGFTDKTLTSVTSNTVPFEPWMLDENWTLNQLSLASGWKGAFIRAVDKNPPKPSYFPSVNFINEVVAHNNVLFTFGKLDSFLDSELMFREAQRFNTGENVSFKTFEGGHGAAFSKEGAEYLNNWANSLLSKH